MRVIVAGWIGTLLLVLSAPISATAAPAARGSAPQIVHRPVDTVLTGRALYLRARLRAGVASVARLRLHYRWSARGPFLQKAMPVDDRGDFVGCVPPARIAAARLQYYLEGVDVRGRRRVGYGSAGQPVVVRAALGPATARGEGLCPDGEGKRVERAGPTRAQLRRVAYRKRALALEERGQKRRNAGRGLVYAGLGLLAAGGGLAGYGLAEGMTFIWMGAGLAGVAVLLTVVGAPVWASGNRLLRRARHQLRHPKAVLPAPRRHHPLARGPSLPPSGRRAAVLSWRFRF